VNGTTVAEVMAELAALEDPKARAVNERHGDDHGVNLGRLRAIAKRLRTQQNLARGLWETGDTAARLLALLICRPKAFDRDELDRLEVLKEYPTPPNCTSPFAPVWITEMVRRQDDRRAEPV
jgi:3-methyladenine DNA glycosylase AlkD